MKSPKQRLLFAQKLILVEVTGVQFTFLLTKGTVRRISDTPGKKYSTTLKIL